MYDTSILNIAIMPIESYHSTPHLIQRGIYATYDYTHIYIYIMYLTYYIEYYMYFDLKKNYGFRRFQSICDR